MSLSIFMPPKIQTKQK